MISSEMVFDVLTWVIKVLFLFGLFPQLWLNYQHHSTKGMSGLMLWGYFNGYLTATYYVYCLNLPLAYKVIVPLSLAAVALMVLQRFVYDKDFGGFWYYAGSLVVGFVGLPLAFSHPNQAGHLFGWLSVIIWAIYQFPQIVKIYLNKTVVGFSFLLVSAIGVANIIEAGMSAWMGLPTQSVLSGLRGAFVYAIFCVQFLLYHKNCKRFIPIRIRSKNSESPLL